MTIGKIKIKTDAGELAEAQAPVVVSASRSTDIPAFYSRWFMNRLEKGYVMWQNPFNQQPLHVSFQETKAIVFWSKNPRPLLPYLKELDSAGMHYYFQFTLNDYEHENLERNVPPLAERIETFRRLSEMTCPDKIIWRFDPLIITPRTSVRNLLEKIWHIGNKLKGFTNKLVFSFVDVMAYKKVQNNLLKETTFYTKGTIKNAEPSGVQIKEFVHGLAKIKDRWNSENWDIEFATCAENIDLSSYGIRHNCCIDGQLMEKLFSHDTDFIHYLRYGKFSEQNLLFPFDVQIKIANLKDRGQRKNCGCIISKDIGAYNTCRHGCIYCYANISSKTVHANALKYSDDGEILTGTAHTGRYATSFPDAHTWKCSHK
jgi:DNA repair photolyase